MANSRYHSPLLSQFSLLEKFAYNSNPSDDTVQMHRKYKMKKKILRSIQSRFVFASQHPSNTSVRATDTFNTILNIKGKKNSNTRRQWKKKSHLRVKSTQYERKILKKLKEKNTISTFCVRFNRFEYILCSFGWVYKVHKRD